ncbi:Uncharacterised protein [Legionella donaldsonii]|uniref:Uncharacterized protein n=1 Tax=Legionella donaldsonii TaxID=45060 RepID=A0A378J313_9GAMM|nr:Uncharacterised protein [Legionella donaldsonii]
MFPNCLRLLKAYKIKLLWIYDLGEGVELTICQYRRFSIPPAGWETL